MYKFRTMRPNAGKEIAALLAVQDTSEKPLGTPTDAHAAASIDKRQRGHGRLSVCPEAPGRQPPRFRQPIECTVKDEACR